LNKKIEEKWYASRIKISTNYWNYYI
jgi:hypothetical protein